MARVNVYLPDELADQVRAAGLNVSGVAQEALRAELRRQRNRTWIEQVRQLPPVLVTHDDALGALDDAREERCGTGG